MICLHPKTNLELSTVFFRHNHAQSAATDLPSHREWSIILPWIARALERVLFRTLSAATGANESENRDFRATVYNPAGLVAHGCDELLWLYQPVLIGIFLPILIRTLGTSFPIWPLSAYVTRIMLRHNTFFHVLRKDTAGALARLVLARHCRV